MAPLIAQKMRRRGGAGGGGDVDHHQHNQDQGTKLALVLVGDPRRHDAAGLGGSDALVMISGDASTIIMACHITICLPGQIALLPPSAATIMVNTTAAVSGHHRA